MTLTGVAQVRNIDGTVTIGTAIAVIPESAEGEHYAEVDEFKNGANQLLGLSATDERYNLELVLIPKAATLALAYGGLAYPSIPAKVTLAGFVADSPDTVKVNGDYIYKGGAKRTLTANGRAALRMPMFRPIDLASGITVTTLTTATT